VDTINIKRQVILIQVTSNIPTFLQNASRVQSSTPKPSQDSQLYY